MTGTVPVEYETTFCVIYIVRERYLYRIAGKERCVCVLGEGGIALSPLTLWRRSPPPAIKIYRLYRCFRNLNRA